MDNLACWPPTLLSFLDRAYGALLSVERLDGGMSPARVSRLQFAETSVVVKASPRSKETVFYERIADQLRPAGLPIPALHWSAQIDGEHWLVLEDIPDPLPLPHHLHWRPDARTVAVLARLHTQTPTVPAGIFDIEQRDWSDDVTAAALSFFAPEIARELVGPLRALQAEGQHVTAAWCWIAGDPNPTNWGLRRDDTVALYDWELFRRGTPAIDLAVLVLGNGDMPKYEALAACYLENWRSLTDAPPWSSATLARDIALAKVWTVTWFLNCIVTNPGEGHVPDRLKAQLTEFVPPWLSEMTTACC
jgi:aminoglycoside phosphotransferase (APT) family kinase protein